MLEKLCLTRFKKNTPKAPTKFLDYQIALILAKLSASQNSNALDFVKKSLGPNATVVPHDELTAALALLWLRFRMFGRVKSNKHPNCNTIEHFYRKTGATQAQIDLSILIGQQLYQPIQQAFQAHTAELLNPQSNLVSNISNDYLLGYHMGDGSFQIQTEFYNNNGSFKSRFCWTLTDCAENEPLLKAIQSCLLSKGVSGMKIKSYGTFHRLTLSRKSGCLALVELLGRANALPSVRFNQYNCFVKALNLYNLSSFKANLDQAEEFINLKWSMNPGTNSKKVGDLNKDLTNIREWFELETHL